MLTTNKPKLPKKKKCQPFVFVFIKTSKNKTNLINLEQKKKKKTTLNTIEYRERVSIVDILLI